ncbi:6,7-dimethyl-8-ribityllumazine synthase [Buchnera aphidicola (Thelaxes californica)]|uniref:6,7-dimethyl-8-ribityllumazine synthase n=1 Tax=Buchnera aphidicola (Thelaxes californica) TaxID=1315998 RepID=A0A4D6YP36_9GAMM|nr:6,7-dimethyl-8-ribityllumazine synthase [Buchnera aphidicola]QCI26875.1 6,7-dimethyl-8-ribityllumazine synthase [Buchnera aphidicola (Thelaxes californica)]
MNIIESDIQAQEAIISIIISRTNNFVNKNLLSGSLDTLIRIGNVNKKNIHIIYVPGTYEIPLIAKKISILKKHHAIIVLGSIIQGDTIHFKNLSFSVSNILMEISIQYTIPIALGILTTQDINQAIERSGVKKGNTGSEAALCALEMLNLIKNIENKVTHNFF